MPELTRTPLSKGYLIEGYRIERLLGGGGFSLVYLASQIKNKQTVVIKEYFPSDLVDRLPGGKVVPHDDEKLKSYRLGIKRFFNEAIALSKLEHPNIVHVQNFFRYNDTVYYVMNYERGRDIRWFIKRSAGRLGNEFMWKVFPQVALGLRELHKNGFLHLDIKPANILLRAGGKPLLLDFGAVQPLVKGSRFKGVQTLTHGFAAPEQYRNGAMGPWSDIYALGATMYGCITGEPPPPALERLDNDTIKPLSKTHARKYAKPLLTAIEWAIQLDYNYRPQDVDSFLKLALDGAPDDIVNRFLDEIEDESVAIIEDEDEILS